MQESHNSWNSYCSWRDTEAPIMGLHWYLSGFFHLGISSHVDIPLFIWGVRCHVYLFLLPYIRAFLSRTKGLCKGFVGVVVKKSSKFEIGEWCFLKPFHKLLSDLVPGSWQYEATSFQTVNRGNDQIHPAISPISLKCLEILMQSKLISASSFPVQDMVEWGDSYSAMHF